MKTTNNYIQFLLINCFKKFIIYIIGGIYLLFLLIFLLIIPKATHTNPLDLWTNVVGIATPQMMLMFIGAIFGAILAINIFKDYRDNGSELIISTKPILRFNMVFCKAIAFIIVSIVFSICSSAICSVTFAFDVNSKIIISLMLSVLISTFVFVLIFGFISIFVSIFFNKIWTVIINTIIVIGMVVFYIVAMFNIPSPATLANKKETEIFSYSYINKNGKMANAVSFSPTIDFKHGMIANNMQNVQDEKKFWDQCTYDSNSKITNKFNLAAQFAVSNNQFGLQNYVTDSVANGFGSCGWYNYDFNEQVSTSSNANLTPLYFPNINVHKAASYWDGKSKTLTFEEYLNFIGNWLQDSSVYMLGDITSNSQSIFDTTFTPYDHKIAWINDGYSGFRNNLKKLTYDELNQYTDSQKKVFDDFINKIIDGKVWMPPETEKANIFPSYAFIDKNYQESRWDTIMDPADKYIKVENIYDYIHYFLIKYASDLGIDLNSEDALFDVSMNFLKLKLYIFQKCCNDFTSKYCNDFEGETNIYNDSNVSLYTLNQKTILPTIDNNDSYNEMIDPLKWKNPFFTDEDTQKMKTLIGTILNMSSYGYTSTDLKDSSRDQCYNNSLYYFSFNMPLMYQPLLSTFTIKSDTNFSTIPLVWIFISLMIGGVVLTAYYKIDFK